MSLNTLNRHWQLPAWRLRCRRSRGGVKLTYLPFLIKALSIALKDFPEINATFSENQESVIQVVYEALSCKCMRPYATK